MKYNASLFESFREVKEINSVSITYEAIIISQFNFYIFFCALSCHTEIFLCFVSLISMPRNTFPIPKIIKIFSSVF